MPSRIGFSASRSNHLARGREQKLAGRSESASDHDQLGVVRIHDAAEPGSELSPDLLHQLVGSRVTLVCQANEPVRVGGGPERLAGDLVGSLSGDVGLRCP
jgi:hypothetical protein